MSTYNVTTETKVTRTLTIDNYTRKQLEVGDAIVCGNLPTVGGNTFTYARPDSYTFGCGTGRFDYATLLKTIAEAQAGDKPGATIQGLLKNGERASRVITSPIVSEEGNYYICQNGRAYLKTDYAKTTTTAKPNRNFGAFKWATDGYYGNQYLYAGHTAGSRKDILDAMLKAKEIIDFIEQKDKYAPVVTPLEAKIEEVKTKKVSNK